MDQQRPESGFFYVGGTVPVDSPSYVRREADEQLYQAIKAGQYCYILCARQMGKSSLIIRAQQQLVDEGYQTINIDLSIIGIEGTPEQWYQGLLTKIADALSLRTKPEEWWQRNRHLGSVQRFSDYIHEVVLKETQGPIVIFIDEIDTTLALDFSDDFFAAIRAMYNQRASAPEFNRLIFILLGVATPTDLIQDARRTPFNIGQAIELVDFTQAEAAIFGSALKQVDAQRGQEAFERIYGWTNGQPYLTQKLCHHALHNLDNQTEVGWQVDNWVRKLFIGEQGVTSDLNLKFIQDYVDNDPAPVELVRLYDDVYRGKKVAEDQRSVQQNHLRLYGLTGVDSGYLRVRNRIYREAFDRDWIQKYLPVNRIRQVALIAIALILGLAIILGAWEAVAEPGPFKTVAAEYRLLRHDSSAPPVEQYETLKYLSTLDGYGSDVTRMFLMLPPEEQLQILEIAANDDLNVLARMIRLIKEDVPQTVEGTELERQFLLAANQWASRNDDLIHLIPELENLLGEYFWTLSLDDQIRILTYAADSAEATVELARAIVPRAPMTDQSILVLNEMGALLDQHVKALPEAEEWIGQINALLTR